MHYVLVVALGVFSFSMWSFTCRMYYRDPGPRIKPRAPTLGSWSLNYWNTREVPDWSFLLSFQSLLYLFPHWFYHFLHFWLWALFVPLLLVNLGVRLECYSKFSFLPQVGRYCCKLPSHFSSSLLKNDFFILYDCEWNIGYMWFLLKIVDIFFCVPIYDLSVSHRARSFTQDWHLREMDTLVSEWFEPQIGYPRPLVLCVWYKPHSLVGEVLGWEEGL